MGTLRGRVVADIQSSYAADGSIAVLYFSVDGGRKAELTLSAQGLHRLAGQLSELSAHIRNQALVSQKHVEIEPSRLVKTMAAPAAGGAAVILTMMTHNGVEHHFALSPGDAAGFATDVTKAASNAARQSKAPRN